MRKYCSRCGVELEDRVTRCPLCGRELTMEELGDITLFTPYPDEEKDGTNNTGFLFPQKRKIILEITAIICISAIIIAGFIDYNMHGFFSWSYYPVFSIITAWLFVLFAFFLFGKPWIMTVLCIGTVAVFLTAIDFVDGSLSWTLHIGFPLVLWTTIISGAIVGFSVKAKTKGANIAGFVLIGAAVICMGIDAIINYYLEKTVLFTWSYVVLLSCVPSGVLCIYLHYRLKTPGFSRKHFHF